MDSEKRNRLWRYGLLLLSLLPVLMVAGSCPDFSGTTAVGAEAVAWFCRLLL